MIALVGVVGQREGGDDESTGHVAHLLAQPLCVLADSLVPREAKPRDKTTNHWTKDYKWLTLSR